MTTTRWKLRDEWKDRMVFLPGAGRMRSDKILIGAKWGNKAFAQYLEPVDASAAPAPAAPADTSPSALDAILADYKGASVGDIEAELDELSDDELIALREFEVANKNRVTLLRAIDEHLEDE